ncbi:hypothetical protein ABZV77_13980 [Streptomyces sp. NPDC004732]
MTSPESLRTAVALAAVSAVLLAAVTAVAFALVGWGAAGRRTTSGDF